MGFLNMIKEMWNWSSAPLERSHLIVSPDTSHLIVPLDTSRLLEPLDRCRLIEKRDVIYSMSLLALCGFHGRKDMVDLLLQKGAGNATLFITEL